MHTTIFYNKLATAFFLWLVLASTLHAADKIEVISLQNRPASEIIPLIKPFAGDNAAVTGQGFKLIIRAPEETLVQIRELVAQLDRSPKRLRISLRRSRQEDLETSDISASGTISAGDARIEVDGGGPATIRLHETRRHSTAQGTHSINTLEGRQAFMQTGQLVPVGESRTDIFGNRSNSIHYKNISTGFYVLPRISGEYVNLEIRSHSTSLNRHGQQTFSTQRASTNLRGRIGTWMPLAGVSQRAESSGSRILHSTRRNDYLDTQLYIKVEVIEE